MRQNRKKRPDTVIPSMNKIAYLGLFYDLAKWNVWFFFQIGPLLTIFPAKITKIDNLAIISAFRAFILRDTVIPAGKPGKRKSIISHCYIVKQAKLNNFAHRGNHRICQDKDMKLPLE